jgi:4'-phosphopantetheinyl transferase
MDDRKNQFEEFIFVQPYQVNWKLGNEVHVWKFPVLPADYSILSDSEKIIVKRFRLEDDRDRYVIGRKSLRLLLSKYLSVNPSDIQIIAERGQKPYIKSPDSAIRFNISHSGEWVIIAFAQNELGVDIEKIDSAFDYTNLLPEHFSLEEQLFVSRSENPVSAFYFLWTRKEALTKAAGNGLRENLNRISVLDSDLFSGIDSREWKIKSFNLSPHYPVSLAYCQSHNEIYCLDGVQFLLNSDSIE